MSVIRQLFYNGILWQLTFPLHVAFNTFILYRPPVSFDEHNGFQSAVVLRLIKQNKHFKSSSVILFPSTVFAKLLYKLVAIILNLTVHNTADLIFHNYNNILRVSILREELFHYISNDIGLRVCNL